MLARAGVVVGDGFQVAAIQHPHRGRAAHHRDLRGGPRDDPVGAEAARVHHDVGAAVRLAQHDAEARHRGRRVRVQELRAVTNDAPPLEIATGLVAAGVDEGDDRQVERVAPLHEAGGLARRLDVEGAGAVHRLVGDDAHRSSTESTEAGDHVGRVRGPELEEGMLVEHVADDGAHVVRGGGAGGHDRCGLRAVAIDRVVGLFERWVLEMVRRQVTEQRVEGHHRFVFVGDDERGDTTLTLVHRGAAESVAVDGDAGERDHDVGAAHVGERIGGHDHVVGDAEQERRTRHRRAHERAARSAPHPTRHSAPWRRGPTRAARRRLR